MTERTLDNRRGGVSVKLKRVGNDVILRFKHDSEEDADEHFHALAVSIKNRTPYTMFAEPPDLNS
jgi:hypothetical protein